MPIDNTVRGDPDGEAIRERVFEIVKGFTGLGETERITGTSKLDELGIDSLDAQEIIMEVEDEYDFSFPDDYRPDGTVDSFVEDVRKYISEK